MKTALITGGQQGIGLGIAQALSAAGFAVVMAAEVEESGTASGQRVVLSITVNR